MPAYHQMGHNTSNLLNIPEIGFAGAILSPVNSNFSAMKDIISKARKMDSFEIIFDPQLYFPRTEKECLRDWDYFPCDFFTANLSSSSWWESLNRNVISTSNDLGVDCICSPLFVPKRYDNDYFFHAVEVGNMLYNQLRGSSIIPIQTAIVGLQEISIPKRSLEVASILSNTLCERIYLIFHSQFVPRKELSDTEQIKGAMKLISLLEASGINILVGFTSLDMILWKFAGADSCATGKYYNLRRFTESRFDDTPSGGGQLPYWTEESLLAFIREADVLRLYRNKFIDRSSISNPFALQILDKLMNEPGSPWLGLSWRQYMYSFSHLLQQIESGQLNLSRHLKKAEENWLYLEEINFLLEEPRNTGDWIRSWRIALNEYSSF